MSLESLTVEMDDNKFENQMNLLCDIRNKWSDQTSVAAPIPCRQEAPG